AGSGQGVSTPHSKNAGNDQGNDGGIPVAGQVQLRHLLSGAQEPKERSAYYQTRKMHQRGEPAKGSAEYQKLVGWTGHELPSGLTPELSRAAKRRRLGRIARARAGLPIAITSSLTQAVPGQQCKYS